MSLRDLLRRLHSSSVFTLIALCFLLPFATVTSVGGCGEYTGGTTSFTGIQLVTRAEPPATGDSTTREAVSTSRDVERNGALPAEVAFGAAIVGVVVGLLGLARGPGVCAAVGLLALLQMFFSLSGGSASSDDGFDWTSHAGFYLVLGLAAWPALVHLDRWRARRLERSRIYSLGVAAGLFIPILVPLGTAGVIGHRGFIVTPFALLGLPAAAAFVYVRRRRAGKRLGVVMRAGYWEYVGAAVFVTYLSLIAGIATHLLWLVPLLGAGGAELIRLAKGATATTPLEEPPQL
jgi:hypothetical protein